MIRKIDLIYPKFATAVPEGSPDTIAENRKVFGKEIQLTSQEFYSIATIGDTSEIVQVEIYKKEYKSDGRKGPIFPIEPTAFGFDDEGTYKNFEIIRTKSAGIDSNMILLVGRRTAFIDYPNGN
jgi:hypothetical protein